MTHEAEDPAHLEDYPFSPYCQWIKLLMKQNMDRQVYDSPESGWFSNNWVVWPELLEDRNK